MFKCTNEYMHVIHTVCFILELQYFIKKKQKLLKEVLPDGIILCERCICLVAMRPLTNCSICEHGFVCNISNRTQFCLNDPLAALIVSASDMVITSAPCRYGKSKVRSRFSAK